MYRLRLPPSGRRLVACCGVLGGLLLAARPQTAHAQLAAPQAAPAEAAARAAFEEGRLAYDTGGFAQALVHFERAYTLSGNAKLLFNIARAADADGQPERACTAYDAYLQRVPQADNRQFVEARLAKLRTPPAEPARAAPRTDEPAAARPPSTTPSAATVPSNTEPAVLPTATPAEPEHRADNSAAFRGARRFRLHFGARLSPSAKFKEISTSKPIGGQLGLAFLIHRLIGIGFEARVTTFTETDDEYDEGRMGLLEFVVSPSVRYSVTGLPIELYAVLPVGLTVPFAGQYVDDHVGPTLGLAVGAVWFFVPHVGISFDVGGSVAWIGDRAVFSTLSANLVFALAKVSS